MNKENVHHNLIRSPHSDLICKEQRSKSEVATVDTLLKLAVS